MAVQIPESIQNLIDQGEYSSARSALEEAAENPELTETEKKFLLFEAERLRRIPLDFSLTAEDALEQIQKDIPDATMEDVQKWTNDGSLESRMIDGQRLYFRRSVRNMYILNKNAAARRKTSSTGISTPEKTEHGEITDMKVHAANALRAREKSDSPYVYPRRFRITYTLTVNPGEVPEGETIRCWLPYPKDVPTQKDIKLISTQPEKHFIAPDECEQRTIYMEQPSPGNKPAKFSATYEYTAYAFVEPVNPKKVKTYDTGTPLYRKYTAERPTQIVFTPEIRRTAARICGDEVNPYLKAKKIFEWVQSNIPWSGAIEYSTVPCLAMRALKRKTGDCGMQGLLFISLCRVCGVPAKWQSGWSLRPARENMHDWAQFYVEPYGWLYADASRGLMNSDDPDVKWFNFGNFDTFRMIVNTNYGDDLIPPKKHFRSEPVDFQRGEVEWNGGNLYFDRWDWDFEVVPVPLEKE